jgi:hypothetical protein
MSRRPPAVGGSSPIDSRVKRSTGAGTIGSRATSLPRWPRPPGSPVHTDPGAESDPSSSTPHRRVNRRYLRRSCSRRSSRSILGSTVKKGVRGEGADRAEDRRSGLLTLPPGAEQLPRRSRLGRSPLPFLSPRHPTGNPRGRRTRSRCGLGVVSGRTRGGKAPSFHGSAARHGSPESGSEASSTVRDSLLASRSHLAKRGPLTRVVRRGLPPCPRRPSAWPPPSLLSVCSESSDRLARLLRCATLGRVVSVSTPGAPPLRLRI